MKFLGAVVCILLLACAGGCLGEPQTLRVGVGENYAPWAYPDENGEYAGFDVESVKWIAKQNNMEVEIVPLPWDNIVDRVADGTVDVVYCGLTITPERAEVVDFSMPYLLTDRGVAVRADSNLTREEVFSGKVKVGAVAGGTGYFWTVEHYPDADVIPIEDIDLAFKELAAGDIDAIVFGETTVNRYARSGPFKVLDVINVNEPFAVGIRKGDTGLRDMFNEWIPKLRSDMEWQTLHAKYNIPYD